MIVALLTGLVLHTKGYYIALIYLSAALAFFLLRTLKLRIEPEVNKVGDYSLVVAQAITLFILLP
jgi:hypothetical protein